VFAKRQSFAFQCRARAAAAMSRAPREAVRPEERAGGDADKYYDREVTEAYTELNVRTQSELTTRCLDMLCLEGEARDAVLLDVGCGSGLSGETLTRQGYRAWVGIDASAAMLERATRGRSASKRTADEKEPPADDAREREDARAKGKNKNETPPARGAVLRGDFSQGLPFRAGAFDGCVSVSAAQWLCVWTRGKRGRKGGGDENDDDVHFASAAVRENLSRFFAALRVALRPGACAALQVYPRTVRETAAFEEALARVERMRGTAVVAFPHGNASKKLFVCARRDDDDVVDDDDDASRRLAPPRCLLAWPHAATCEAAWHDSLRAFRAFREKQKQKQKHELKSSTRARSDREHVAAQRRALRSLRRARVAAYASRVQNAGGFRGADVFSTRSIGMLAPFDAAGPGGTVTETFDAEEDIARDGSVCPCARVGVLTSARVVSLPRNAGDGASTDAEKPRRTFSRDGARGETKKASLEDPLSLTPLGAPQSVETRPRVCPRANAASASVSTLTFQEFVLRTSFGDFGVFAAQTEARAKEGEEGVRKKEGETSFAADAASVSTRARAALGACLRGAGSVVCAAVLSRSSRDPSVGSRGGREDMQVWVLWWPSRVVGGASAEKNAGFLETSGLRESVRDAFS